MSSSGSVYFLLKKNIMCTKKMNVEIWIKGDFLLRCILPLNPSPGLQTYNLRRTIAYLKSKEASKADASSLSYASWQHVACEKLGLSTELALTYFLLVADYEMKSKVDRIESDLVLEKDFAQWSTSCKVPLLPFILMLFLQQANRRNMRDCMKMPDKYPTRRVDERLGTSQTEKENLEICIFQFVTRNLRNLVELVALCEQQSFTNYRKPDLLVKDISIETLSALDVLFEGRLTIKQRNKHEIRFPVSLSTLVKAAVPSSAPNLYSIRSIENLLSTCLRTDPFGVASPSCGFLASRSVFKDVHAAGDSIQRESSQEANSRTVSYMPLIFHNSNYAPSDHKTVICNNIIGRTIIKGSTALDGSVTHVTNCKDAFVYFMVPLKCLIIRKCKQTRIVSSHVDKILRLHYCRDVTVIASCRRLIILDCRRCKFYITTSAPPLILGGSNEDLTFAPYNLNMASVDPALIDSLLESPRSVVDYWNRPLSFYNVNSANQQEQPWSLLDATKFHLLSLPFRPAVDNKMIDSPPQILQLSAIAARASTKALGVPFELPADYRQVMKERADLVRDWNRLTFNIDKGMKSGLDKLMQSHFSRWLQSDSPKKELEYLKKMRTSSRKTQTSAR